MLDKSKALQFLQAEFFGSAIYNGIREQAVTVHPRMVQCEWYASATIRVVRVLMSILELPGMVTLAFAQPGEIVIRVEVFEYAGEDLRQPIGISIHRQLFNTWVI